MIEVNAVTSCKFRQMSFLCACMVVMIHSTTIPPLGTFQWWVSFLIGKEGLCRIAVPSFFVMAGFFLVGHVDEVGWYGRAVKTRIQSLLIPFYIWTIFGVLFSCAIACGIRLVGYSQYNGPIAFPEFTGEWIVINLGLNPFVQIGVLWFVRALFIFVLLSPCLLWVSRSCIMLLGCVILYAAFEVVQTTDLALNNFFNYFISLRGAVYFMVGMVVRRSFDNLKGAHPYCLLIGCALLVLKGVLLVLQKELASRVCDVFMVPFLMMGIWGIWGCPWA